PAPEPVKKPKAAAGAPGLKDAYEIHIGEQAEANLIVRGLSLASCRAQFEQVQQVVAQKILDCISHFPAVPVVVREPQNDESWSGTRPYLVSDDHNHPLGVLLLSGTGETKFVLPAERSYEFTPLGMDPGSGASTKLTLPPTNGAAAAPITVSLV